MRVIGPYKNTRKLQRDGTYAWSVAVTDGCRATTHTYTTRREAERAAEQLERAGQYLLTCWTDDD